VAGVRLPIMLILGLVVGAPRYLLGSIEEFLPMTVITSRGPGAIKVLLVAATVDQYKSNLPITLRKKEWPNKGVLPAVAAGRMRTPKVTQWPKQDPFHQNTRTYAEKPHTVYTSLTMSRELNLLRADSRIDCVICSLSLFAGQEEILNKCWIRK
jgi:hypothetical protein